MICRDIAPNLIRFNLAIVVTWKRFLSMEPWLFNNNVLMLKRADSKIPPTAMKFNTSPCWIQLYDLPMAVSDPHVLRLIGRRFGEVIELDAHNMDVVSGCARLKVLLNLEKPLKRETTVSYWRRGTTMDFCKI